jgi:putative hydrolase of the HAD superfamily
MRYPWILFDADGTLFHFDARQGVSLMLERHGVVLDDDDFARFEAHNAQLWIDYAAGLITSERIREIRFQPWAEATGRRARQLDTDFLVAMADTTSFVPGARELIAALRGRARMGIITNGFTELQPVRLQRLGLSDAFFPVVASEGVGASKPDRRIFDHALDLMGNPPRDQVLMVGDTAATDVRGGIDAGLRTCWLNVAGKPVPEGITPDLHVATLDELRQLLL